ncbi:MAG: hydrogenase nickel incorporation protein HypB [Actinobacteria bacterium]|nr:hydrogenase nickel incorporation protein HypB [Actinomycetota bacterium]
MCATCGCSPLSDPHQSHGSHGQHEPHEHPHDHRPGEEITLEQKILAKNDGLAQQNRAWLRDRGILAVNLMSSPGSGKTTLLERSGRDLAGRLPLSVIEGDQETALDADRIRDAGCQVVQINTGAGCHLDAAMVGGALRALYPPPNSVVIIENVGNLVCPALFDLGEAARVVLASVTEGTDKPLKYPQMFRSADLVVVTKTDLGPYVDFDISRFGAYIGQVSPQAMMIHLSALDGTGLPLWYDWLSSRIPTAATAPMPRVSTPD